MMFNSEFKKTSFIRASLFASAAIMAGVSLPALAQTAPAEDDSANAEIIVTAQKREERLQDIPLAVSVVGGEAVANNGGITLENAQYLVPSLNFRKAGTSLNQALFLRGVGTINFSIAAEPSVAAVLDGVVLSRAGEGFTDLFDVERIEVLRGPQGTLFGKNASAGVVSIVTKRPTAEYGATVEGSFFTKSEYRGRATVNLPLSANVRSRFTGFYGSYDGNINNLTTGKKVNGYEHYSVRGAIEADVGENVLLTLRGDYRKADDDCCAEIIGTAPSNALPLAALSGTKILGDRSRTLTQDLVTTTKEESWGVSLQADIELGDHSLTSITSYRGWDNVEIRDGDWLDKAYADQLQFTGSPGRVGLAQLHDNGPQTSTTFTQELRIASPTGQFLEYVLGAYYSKADSDRTFTRNVITCEINPRPTTLIPCGSPGAGPTLLPSGTADFGSTFKNMSVFGQATVNLSDSLRLIGGLRYTHDELDVYHIRRTSLAGPGVQGNFDAGVYNNGLVATAPATGFVAGASNGVPFTTSTSNNNLSGKAAVQADLTENNMAYASYTRGYKGPAYNIFYNLTTPGAGVIAPETVNAYEVGLKNTLLDGDLIVNLAAYYAKYNNYQANSPDFVAGVRTTRLTNAGSVSTKGFEVDFVATPLRNFTLSGGVAYNKAQVENFRLPPGADASQLVAKGTPLANAPKWKMSFGAQYNIETSGFANIELGSQIAMQSDQIYEASANPAVRLGSTVDGYAIVDLTAALVETNDGWRLAFQVKNLFDKSFASSIVSGGPGGAYRYIIPREADRYFGVTAKINIGAK
jgi:iron complex outermembrane receptor protein